MRVQAGFLFIFQANNPKQPALKAYLFVKEDNVDEDVNFALSAFILAVSLFFVSEN